MNGDFLLGEWRVYPKLNRLARHGGFRHLSPKVMEVLVFLAKRQGDVVSKEEIFGAVWPGTFVTDDAITRCIVELRRIFHDDAREPRIIETIAKRGYRLLAPVTWCEDDAAPQEGSQAVVVSNELACESNAAPRQEVTGSQTPVEDAHDTQELDVGPVSAGLEEYAEEGSQARGGYRTEKDGILVQASVPEAVPQKSPRRVWVMSSILTLALGILIGVGTMLWFRPVPISPVVTSVIKLEPGYALDGMRWRTGIPTRTAFAISRDGSFIVYSANKENPETSDLAHLFLRRIDQSDAKLITGTERGFSPVLSSDEQWIGFIAARKLRKVRIDGGPSMPLCDAAIPYGASWGFDNSIVFSSYIRVGLSRVSSDGGKPEPFTEPSKDEFLHSLPHCLPGGKGVLFTIKALGMDIHPRVVVLDSAMHQFRTLIDDAADARYVPTGHLVFLRQGSLMAVRFDLTRLQVTGQPVPTGIRVAQAMNTSLSGTHDTAAGQFSISDSGTLVYAAGGIIPDEKDSLVWVDQSGNELQAAVPFEGPLFGPRLSPDGKHISYTTQGLKKQVFVYDLDRGTASALTEDGTVNFAVWTPDGKRVVFGGSTSGPRNIFARLVDQSAPAERLTKNERCTGQNPSSCSPDGNLFAFTEQVPDTIHDILILDRRDGSITPFVKSRADEYGPEFSPDGCWLAYTSDKSGRPEVYVQPFPGPGGVWQVSNEGGTEPLWSRDGRRLFYRFQEKIWAQEKVWAVDIRNDGALHPSKPRLLFSEPGKYLAAGPSRTWDVSLDGQRFLMVKLEKIEAKPITELVLVQNWTKELERLCPTRKQ